MAFRARNIFRKKRALGPFPVRVGSSFGVGTRGKNLVGLVVSVLVVAGAVIAFPGALAKAATGPPTLAFRADGTTIWLAGDGFVANQKVRITANVENGNGVATETTNALGQFSTSFTLPRGYTGTVTVMVETIRETVAKVFQVQSPDDTPKQPVEPAGPLAEVRASVSGEVMPVGNLSGWKQIFADDFETDVARGSWPASYGSRWSSYDGFTDTNKWGNYNNEIISVKDSVMRFHLHTAANGVPQVAAPAPIINGKAWTGMTYGRYAVRFRADALPGYKTAWLLWPETDKWTAEINFPEGHLNGNIQAFNHCPGNASVNCVAIDTKARYTQWHTAIIEWTPDVVAFYLDGKLQGTSKDVPHEPMRWILQTETDETRKINPATAGDVEVDWVAMYAYDG